MAAAATLTYSKCTYCMYVYIHVRVYTHTHSTLCCNMKEQVHHPSLSHYFPVPLQACADTHTLFHGAAAE